MPRTTDISKYPPEFLIMLDRAQTGPVVIPDPKPAGLRGYIQAFLRACEMQGADSPLGSKARALQVTSPPGDASASDPARRGPHVLVQRRSDSVYAKRVAAALGTTFGAEVADAEAMLRRRLGA